MGGEDNMASEFADLAQHTGTLVALISSFAIICGILIGTIYKLGLTLKADILAMITSLNSKLDGIEQGVWTEINRIKRDDLGMMLKRQLELREQIPKEYLRVDGLGLKSILDALERIEKHSEKVALELAESKRGQNIR